MAQGHSKPPLVVRERFSWWPHLGAGLAAFLVTGLTVHFFIQHGLPRATKSESVPVHVRVDMPDDLLTGIQDVNSPEAIQNLSLHFHQPELRRQAWQEFLAEWNRSTIGDSAKSPGSCEQFTSSLRVQTIKTEEGFRVDLRMGSPLPREAAEYLKILARRVVRECQNKRDAAQIAETWPHDLAPEAIRVILPAETKPNTWGGMLGLSLGSGLAMAVGVCFISLGSALEPLVARLADLERLLTVPVLGVVPWRDSDDTTGKRGGRRGLCRWALFLGGLLLIGGATASILVVVYQYTVT